MPVGGLLRGSPMLWVGHPKCNRQATATNNVSGDLDAPLKRDSLLRWVSYSASFSTSSLHGGDDATSRNYDGRRALQMDAEGVLLIS